MATGNTNDLLLRLSTADSEVLAGPDNMDTRNDNLVTASASRYRSQDLDLTVSPNDSISQVGGSVRSHDSKRSSVSTTSSIQRHRILEEQKKAELSERIACLRQKQELDRKMLELRLQTEELQLKTDMRVANARSKVMADVEHDRVSQTDRKEYIGSSLPIHMDDSPTRRPPEPIITSTPYKREPDFQYPPLSPDRRVNSSSADDVMLSVVRELKKPQVEIKKFDGDLMHYKKFIRQFNMQIVNNTLSDDERMNFLEQFTTGEANKIVSGYSHKDARFGYPAALRELEHRYADPEQIATRYIKEALNFPTIKADNPKMLDDYAIFLSECEMAVEGLEETKILEYSENLRKLVTKLPYRLHDKWRSIIQDIKDRGGTPRFHDLVKFVKREAKKMSDPVYGKDALVAETDSKKDMNKNNHQRNDSKQQRFHNSGKPKGSYVTASQDYQLTSSDKKEEYRNTSTSQHPHSTTCFEKPCRYCKEQNHSIESCPKLGNLPYHKRTDYLKEFGVCYGCLKPGHFRSLCRRRLQCQTCKRYHPTVLHYTPPPEKEGVVLHSYFNSDKNSKKLVSTCLNSEENNIHMGTGDGECTMAVIPVRVKFKHSQAVITYAFLDPGSSVSFCTRSLMERLGVTGRNINITLNTMGNPYNMETSILKNLEVYGFDGDEKVNIPTIYSTENIPVSKHEAPTQEDLLRWEHLKNLKLPPKILANVGLLIGNAVADAYTPLQTITGPANSPHATRTRLGWIVWNLVRPLSNKNLFNVNRLHIAAIQTLEDEKRLNKLYRDIVNLDFPERTIDDKRELSIEDKRFNDKVNKSLTFKDGHYHLPLPFKQDDVILPNNLDQAIQRLQSLERKMKRNPEFARDYITFMEDVIAKGYAVRVPEEEIFHDNRRIWYVVHHGTYHRRKSKIRVVFDCSAKYRGISLNDVLLQGPDLTNNLIGILLKFRQHEIAIMSDLEQMFYQARVDEKDTDCLRFLWWPEGDYSKDYQTYKMVVHLFGAVSSPSCANTALRQTAFDNITCFSEDVIEAVLHNFYVDDLLKSIPTEKAAIDLVRNLTNLCKKGGFHLTKWMSNSRDVLATIPKDEQAKELKTLNIDQDDLPSGRALGIHWSAETDTIGFDISIQNRPITRRGILSTIGTIYDPLGLVSPFILPARLILQELCQRNYGWDEEIPDVIYKKWNKWLDFLPHLETLVIPRCLKPTTFSKYVACELHHFSDASELGYGTASYIRFVSQNGEIYCTLLFGKSRVAPLKKNTIPRLELTAATVAVKVNRFITQEMDFDFTKIWYWTDSMSVLRYINNETTRFHTFVANRLTVIHEGSTAEQWNYVDSKTNVSDLSSRGITSKCPDETEKWLNGPMFLWKPTDEWIKTKIPSTIPDSDPEVKISTFAVLKGDDNDVLDKLIDYFSSWLKLKKALAWWLLGIDNLKQMVANRQLGKNVKVNTDLKSKTTKTPLLSLDYLQRAERTILLYIQRKSFAEEIKALQSNQNIKKSSTMIKLDPFLKDGLVRVGGRLERSSLSINTKNPILLPKDSKVSRLIIEEAHKSLGHLGKNSVLSKLREDFWIIGANTIIRKIVSKCVICLRYQGKVGEQKMASLPENRLIADDPPFTRVGVDYFGPFEVKRGRSKLKRYGVVFTCLNSRAIHLEVAFSMDTSSCINALRRFIARRGQVSVILSDNGTNFIGTNRELQEEIKKWNINQIHDFLLQRNIHWEFNPPAASHFGGIWERQIRMVRKILYSLLKEQQIHFDDEGLATLFCEIENIINCRPITRSSIDPNDLEPLTPNHLLLLKSSILPPGVFDKKDIYVRRRWRQVQYIANVFWRRWTKEYLTDLQERQKWVQPRRNVVVNDIVLIADSNLPRNSWLLGKVVETHADHKGYVRSVKVKTQFSTFNRPIDKLVLILECDL